MVSRRAVARHEIEKGAILVWCGNVELLSIAAFAPTPSSFRRSQKFFNQLGDNSL